MSAHTPGPWEAVDRLTVRSAYLLGDKTAAGWEVATLPASALAGDSSLIAAAPDLLTALKAAVAHLSSPPPRNEGWNRVLNVAEAAIAKAEGRA